MRCGLAGMIPLMMSHKYSYMSEGFYNDKRPYFDSIIRHESYYHLRYLPSQIARKLFMPLLPDLLKKREVQDYGK